MPSTPQPDEDGVIEAKSAWHATGDPDADEMLAKSTLVRALDKRIRELGLTQTAAAERLGLQRPNLARILSGRFRSISFDQLFKLLAGLGVDVRVTVAPTVEDGGLSVALAWDQAEKVR